MVGGLDWWYPEHRHRQYKGQLLLSSKQLKKCSHRYFFNFNSSVLKDMFRSIIGMAFHRDGSQWKYECWNVLFKWWGRVSLLLAPADRVLAELKLMKLIMLNWMVGVLIDLIIVYLTVHRIY